MFSNIQNGQIAKQNCILHRRKKICETFLKILWDEGFILGYKIDSNNVENILLVEATLEIGVCKTISCCFNK